MKWNFLLTLCVLSSLGAVAQETITAWNFNADNRTPSVGAGSLSLIGGVSETYAAGSEGRAVNTAAYPVQGQNNGTAGIACAVSTVGYENIRLRFHHRASGTASRHAAVDYSIDGGQNWVTGFWNNQGLLAPNDNFYAFTVDFSSVAAANNNPDFRVRVVSVFSPCDFVDNNSGNVIPANTAYMRANVAAQCAPHSTTVTGTYAPTGTWRFDEVMLVGDPIGGLNYPLQIDKNGYVYTQDFNTLADDGSFTAWTDNVTLKGWYWQYGNPDRDPNVQGYRAHYGNLNAVNAASLGDSAVAERALGGIAGSNGRDLFVGLQFQNTTGRPIELSKLKLAFEGEQWRATANQSTLAFSYKINPVTVLNFTNTDRDWISIPDFDFTAPKVDNNLAINGNDPDNRVVFPAMSVDQAGILPNGHFLALRWSLVGVTTPALGIDELRFSFVEDPDFSLNPTASSLFEHVLGTPSAPQMFTVLANNALDSLHLSFGLSNAFEIALQADGPYASSIAIAPTSALFNQALWVRLQAQTAGTVTDSLFLFYNNEKVAFAVLNGQVTPGPSITLKADDFVFVANPYTQRISAVQYLRVKAEFLQEPLVVDIASGLDSMFWIIDANQARNNTLTLTPVNGEIDDSIAIQVQIPLSWAGNKFSYTDSLRAFYPQSTLLDAFLLQVQWELVSVQAIPGSKDFFAYPNPVCAGQDFVLSEPVSGLLRNALGQTVLTVDNTQVVSTQGLTPGMYFLQAHSGRVIKLNIN